MSDNQLTLPYEEITEVANRNFLRDNFRRSNREVYQIPFSNLEEREGFNKRIVFEDIEELAQSIKEQGLKEPLTVDVLPDGRVFIEKGHRRFKALQMIVEQGGNVDYVECYPNPKSVTELQRMTDIYTSNMHSCKLTAIEQAAVVFDLKHNFGKTSSEGIAEKLGISRQKVDMLLLIAEAPDDIKEQIKLNTMGITEACNLVRQQKKLKVQTDQEEENSHKNTAEPTPFPKDELAGEVKSLAKLQEPTTEELELQAEQNMAELLKVSDEIKVRENTIREHIGRKLSAPIIREWVHDFTNAQGEPESKDMSIELIPKNVILTEDLVSLILDTQEIDTIFVYKVGMEPVAPSVITEPVAAKEKDKYDLDRPEIVQIQNIIKLADKIEAVVNKLDCPDQTKLDLGNYVKWLQNDAAEVREWIHNNKKQNKRGS